MSSVKSETMRIRCGSVESFLLRNVVATTDILETGPLKGSSIKSIERALSQLMREERIESHPLKGPKRYYVLTAKAAQEHGINDGRGGTQSLGYQSLLQNLAMSYVAACSNGMRERLTRDEFYKMFPMLCDGTNPPKHYRTRFFLDRTNEAQGDVRLGLFVVDLGRGGVRRLARKVSRQIQQRRVSRFRDMVQNKLLVPHVIVASVARANLLVSSLRTDEFVYRALVVEALGELMR